MMTQYEYKVFTYNTKGVFGGKIKNRELESQLNMFGNEGWEMVSSTSSNQSYGASKSLVFIFKREKSFDGANGRWEHNDGHWLV